MSRDITESQRDWLTGELDAWRADGLVTDEQVRGVLGLYSTALDNRARQQSKGVLTLMALAVVLLGLGVLLLVGYNWEGMPVPAKVGVVLASVASAHGLGLWLRFRRELRRLSEVAFFFGCLLYGAGIWLLAQAFHVNSENADGFWWWAVGTLPLALAFDTLLLHTLSVALLATWVTSTVFNSANLGSWLFGRHWSVPNAGYSLLPLAGLGLAWAYRKKSARAVALYVPLLAWWVILQPFAWGLRANPVYFIGAVGGLLLLLAEAHRPGNPMGLPFRFYGTALTAGVLVPLSYLEFNRDGGPSQECLHALYLTFAILALAVAVVAEVAVVRRRSRLPKGRASLVPEAVALVRDQGVPCGLIALMFGLGLWSALSGEPLVPTILANLAMLMLAGWLARVGLNEDRGRPFSMGVAYFLLWAVLRYVDLFGAFGGMLGGALVFFLCGATLLGVALFWRHRKGVSLA